MQLNFGKLCYFTSLRKCNMYLTLCFRVVVRSHEARSISPNVISHLISIDCGLCVCMDVRVYFGAYVVRCWYQLK